MSERIDYRKVAQEAVMSMTGMGKYLAAEKFDPKLKALVEMRVSQINGCAYCLNVHSQEARAAGETQQRLDVLAAWRETTFFTEKETAALAWAEALTLLPETHAPDDIYEEAAKQFPGKELVDLSIAIINMNAWNRLAVGFHAKVQVRHS